MLDVEVSLIEKIISAWGIDSKNAAIIISIAVLLMLGFLMTRVTKRLKLPNVTAYIIVGVLLVPIWKVIPAGITGIIPDRVVNGMDFLSDIALAFIAFSTGEYFKIGELKKSGAKLLVITLFEALTAFVLVFIICAFALGINISFSLVLAALASATAPASTIMTIRQTKAKGEYVNTLLEVIAFDNVISLLLYSIAISICLALLGGSGVGFSSIGLPIIKNIACLIIGIGFGFLLKVLLPKSRTKDNRLIIAIALLFGFCGICALLEQSPLLGCMAMSIVYINISGDEKLFKQLNYFSPPIMLLFFVMSGMKFNLKAFTNMTLIGYVPLFVAA
ncbi:MAG: cation:proton antiporter, partial [Acholeplasmatales bacterium]|nr:cation:proton antiporter [Acholeplasmatales bacterium]